MTDCSLTDRRALIVGCGIAGPVVAMFLERIGVRTTVFEAAAEPRDDEGFWLSLAPNGLAVLDVLGIADRVLEEGTRTESLVMVNHRGRTLGEFDDETLTIERGVLTRILREAAIERGVSVEFEHRLVDVDQRESAVTATFEDGTDATGDLLVGCDGIHSPTRNAAFPAAPGPTYTGLVDTGGFAESASVSDQSDTLFMTFGYEGFFGYQAVPSGEVYWFENHARPTEPERGELERVPNDRWIRTLLERHRRDPPPIATIIRSTDDRMGKWPSYVLPTQPSWHEGRVCLLGDAAHAMNPASGQGAALAMEDAIVLAQCLRDVSGIERALGTYEAIRRDRIDRVAKHAERTGDRKSPSNRLGRAIRDLVLPFFVSYGLKEKREIYSFRVDWTETIEGVR